MKIKSRVLLLAGTGLASLAAVVLMLTAGTRRETGAASSSPAALYTVGEWNGQLAVYVREKTEPEQVYDVYITTLPEEEQRRLQQGVPVEDEETLLRLLEDYTS